MEKSIFGVQTGFLGVWIHNERRLSNFIALRTELGLDAGIFGGGFQGTKFILTPTITLEPRFYYNLNNRSKKGNSISKNSGNFLALRVKYDPDLFTISNQSNVSVIENVSIIPKWGIRRVIGEHFTYEIGIGVGYIHYFSKNLIDNNDVAADLHLRIGYTF